MKAKLDEQFYSDKSWGSVPINDSHDLPSLKLRYLLKELAKRTKPDAQLLEVGSGSGRILSSIRERDTQIQLTGIDLSAGQTALATTTHPSIKFICANGEELPFNDDSFDFVVFFDYLEHIERPRQSLAEIYRVLRPGGILYLVCPTEAQSIFWLSKLIFRVHFKEKTAGHIQQYSRKSLQAMIEECGLRVIDKKYSYHLLGSLMDYALFTLMLNKRIYNTYWTKNAYYARSKTEKKGGIFNFLLKLGNAVAFGESSLFKNTSLTSTAMHITSQKPL